MKRLIFATIFAAMTGTVLHAQNLKADIPFDFRAGKTVLPAGHYVIEGKQGYIVVRQVGKGANNAVMLLTHAGEPAGKTGEAHLTFHRYGDSYFLRKIWGGYSTAGRDIPGTSTEKEMARTWTDSAKSTTLVASRE